MRYWRILLVEDEREDLANNIYELLLVAPREAYRSMGLEYIPGAGPRWARPQDFPYRVTTVSSARECLFALKNADLPPDCAFIDVKLDKHHGEETRVQLDSLKADLVNAFPHATGKVVDEIDGLFDISGEGNVFLRGGLFVMALAQKLFPGLPIRIYSESLRALRESILHQYLGLYSITESGKFLIPGGGGRKEDEWPQMLMRITRGYYETHRLSRSRTLDALAQLKRGGDGDWGNATAEEIAAFLSTPIGSSEKGWTVGSAFPLQVPDVVYGPSSKRAAAMSDIHSLVLSLDLGRSFAQFVCTDEGYFDCLSHANDGVKTLPASGQKPVDLRKDDPRELSRALQKMLSEWQNSPCYLAAGCECFQNLLGRLALLSPDELQGPKGNDCFTSLETAKNIVRLPLEGIIKQLEFAENHVRNLRIREVVGAFGQGDDGLLETLREFDDANTARLSGMLDGDPRAALPGRSMAESPLPNMLGDLLGATLHAIYKHGFGGDEGAVEMAVGHDATKEQWVVVVSQLEGSSFSEGKLQDRHFFEAPGGDFRKMLRFVRGWIQVKIRSGNIERDPHVVEAPTSGRECHMHPTLTNVSPAVQFEYRISTVLG